MEQKITQTVCSGAFVAGLAAVGLLSHTAQTGPHNLGDLLKGVTQSRYEDTFKGANPLKKPAISAIGAIKYAIFGQAAEGAIVGNKGWLFTTEELNVTPHFAENVRLSVERIGLVNDEMARRGIHLLTVIVPDKAEVYTEQLGVERVGYVVERRGMLSAALAERGVSVLDGSSALKRAKSRGDVFMRDDTHWSPLGSQAVSETVADSLVGFELAKANVTTRAVGTAQFDGDLLAYVPTGGLRPLMGPAQNQIEQFETTVGTKSSLFDDVPIDVVLVGTSFSAKADWHFEGFLKQALQADILNFAQEGRGPFAPMEAFMASDTFQNQTPKIVIWEIPARYTSKDHTK